MLAIIKNTILPWFVMMHVMNSGKLSLVDSDTDDFKSVYNQVSGGDSPFDIFAETILIDKQINLIHDKTAYKGRAAVENAEKISNKKIEESGEINDGKSIKKITKVTEFVLVPDEILIVNDSSGDFLIPLLNRNTAHSVFEAKINLSEYIKRIEDPEYWKVGFENRTDGAENGVLHGESVLRDSDIGGILDQSQKNQIGVTHQIDDGQAKSFVTKSGYLELYEPDYDIEEYIQYVFDYIEDCLQIK
jgi:hypothetical protein